MSVLPGSRSGLSRPLLLGIFFIAMAMLLLEVVLTRIFSVTMYYHFAFMVVSITLFGMGVSGIFVYLRPQTFVREKSGQHVTTAATLFALSVPICYLLQRWIPSAPDSPTWGLLYLGLTYVVIAIPFFLGGMSISLALTHYGSDVATLYFADLVGASVGCALVFPGLTFFKGPDLIAFVGVLGGCAALSFSFMIKQAIFRQRALGVFLALLVLFGMNVFEKPLILNTGSRTIIMPDSRQAVEPIAVEWNPMSRVMVYKGSTRPSALPGKPDSTFFPPEQMLMVLDKSAMTWAVGFDGDWDKVRWIFSDISTLPLWLKPGAKVLDIGSGGGQQALVALGMGSKDITCVEINPTVMNWVKTRFDTFTGHIYNRPEVHPYVGDGRTFVARSKEKYDVICFVSATTFTATTSGAFMMAENNLFTMEAFREYYDHLNPDGLISVSQVITREYPGLLLRVVSLCRGVLEERGVQNVSDQIVVVMKKQEGYGNVLMKKGAFTAAELDSTDALCARMGWVVLHSPRLNNHPEFSKIITMPNFHAVVAAMPLNLFPPTDDKPFFFNLVPFDKLNESQAGNFNMKYGKLPAQILLRLFFVVLVLTVLFLIVPLFLARRAHLSQAPGMAPTLGFFMMIGLGFIMVEVPLMQRFVLYLGHPVYAISVILFSLLLFSGIGSFLTRAVTGPGAARWLKVSLPALLVLLLVYNFTLELLFHATQHQSVVLKILLSVLLLMPMGILMGMPFPTMMRRVYAWSQSMIPWCWGVNGATSVLGSVSGVIIALSWGFSASLITGMAAYLIALICVFMLPAVEAE